ncbi:hypothetical protein [Aestuariibaculum sediminum]|uniref:Uncharacterized protein n=1 Tax=Aestuariibaculum sediminum TaxID=2770637 RepID=A0A8J6U9M6_9FLAO|nr:hypothetical protein [Aestuariibaculum sediminum]MBD0833387.1 hypothetical protein [Aestuariibaculum sediminum]
MKTKSKFLTIALLLFTMISFGQKKQDVSVLYVGFDPKTPIPEELLGGLGIASMTPERFKDDYKTRFPEFKSYLETYFRKVKTVDARVYKVEMSAHFDVTIFDQAIKPWKPQVREMVDGKMNFEPAKYLTEDFDHATIFIGHTAPLMGQSIGSKLDWLCLCLDADAHHIKTEHPIFKGPFPVELTLKKKATPEGIFLYPSGKDVPKEIPMWRVQKEGYLEGKGYRVGMVSRGDGFLDSPDAEYISSGVNTKDVGAVAIGRHGNFFMWGFSGSPDYMTDEAKQVFANAVVYMKQFKGKKPIARKYNDRISTKDRIDLIVGSLTDDSYSNYKVYIEKNNEKSAKYFSDLKSKKQNGETLTDSEEQMLQVTPKPMGIPSKEEFFQQVSGSFFEPKYENNIQELIDYLEANRKYMYSDPDGFHSLKIDEDLKKIGVGNDSLDFFEVIIPLLKDAEKMEIAKRVLLRYTGMEKSHKEWRKWYKTNNDKLFFTESGGYKWMINNR